MVDFLKCTVRYIGAFWNNFQNHMRLSEQFKSHRRLSVCHNKLSDESYLTGKYKQTGYTSDLYRPLQPGEGLDAGQLAGVPHGHQRVSAPSRKIPAIQSYTFCFGDVIRSCKLVDRNLSDVDRTLVSCGSESVSCGSDRNLSVVDRTIVSWGLEYVSYGSEPVRRGSVSVRRGSVSRYQLWIGICQVSDLVSNPLILDVVNIIKNFIKNRKSKLKYYFWSYLCYLKSVIVPYLSTHIFYLKANS